MRGRLRWSGWLGCRRMRLHGIQSWVGLPKANEDDAPSFQHVGESRLPSKEMGGVSGSGDPGGNGGSVRKRFHPSTDRLSSPIGDCRPRYPSRPG